MNIKLSKWKPDKIKNRCFSMLITASRNTGKSYLLKDILNKIKVNMKYDIIVVFANSSQVLEFFANFIKGDLFFKDFNDTVIEALIKINDDLPNKKKKRILIILDDTINQKYNQRLSELYCTGRHHNISIIYIIQKWTLVNVTCRVNSDYIIIGQTKGSQERISIIDSVFTGMFDRQSIPGHEREFLTQLIKYKTLNYNFLVVDYTNNSSAEYKDILFYFKAD